MNIFRPLFSQHLFTTALVSAFLVLACNTDAQTITRQQIHINANPFTAYSFTASAANIQNNVNCAAVGNIITPSWVVVGNNTPGMTYCWGGFSTLPSYTAGLINGKSAGDNDCTTNGDCCESCALGVDCSGFVSHAWGLSTKYSTNTLVNISTAYASASDVKEGDIFDLPGSHTRLVDTNYVNGNFMLMESSGVDWKVSYRAYTTAQLTSYTPRWYVNVDTLNATCNHFYETLPYSNSFENVWLMDTCNSGAQRSPDKFWKSNTGGTTPNGDDFWHRNDYTGGDWTTPTSGMYTPAASNGSYSARFRNDPSPAGSTGQMDLYLNLSQTGTKNIQFDYIHNEASPSPFAFNVLLSTDGGLTFPTTLMNITNALVSTWTTQTISTTATSATSVLRFSVTDKGSADVGVDNLTVNPAVVTGINALSNDEAFNLFPNPTDGSVLNGILSEPGVAQMDVHIYNILGAELVAKQVMLDGKNFSIQLNNELPAGVYLFVANEGGKQFRKKVVVK